MILREYLTIVPLVLPLFAVGYAMECLFRGRAPRPVRLAIAKYVAAALLGSGMVLGQLLRPEPFVPLSFGFAVGLLVYRVPGLVRGARRLYLSARESA